MIPVLRATRLYAINLRTLVRSRRRKLRLNESLINVEGPEALVLRPFISFSVDMALALVGRMRVVVRDFQPDSTGASMRSRGASGSLRISVERWIHMADRSAVGKTGKPFTMHVDWSKVREFARAIKDPNPLYFDPELAKKEVGGVPVPVTFLQTSAFWTDETSSPGFGGFDLRRILHGEQEFEFFKPIFVGDTLTGVTKVADVLEKEGGRGGKMTLLITETEYTNQKGEKVAIARSTLIETGQAVKA